jgi:hypothetical protein
MGDMRTTYLLIASSFLAGAVALAQPSVSSETPAQPAESTAATPATLATPAASSAAAASTSAPDAAKAAADAQEKAKATEKRMRGHGYKPVVQRDGTLLYCRKETEMGSHFTKTSCNTAEDIDRIELEAKDTTTRMQQQVVTPQSK